MKSTFSRIFVIATVILLAALLLIGTFFQFLVRDYLTENTMDTLRQQADTIATLAASYAGTDGDGLRTLEFQVNLDVAADVTGADTMIFDREGHVIRSSGDLTLEDFSGMSISTEFIEAVDTLGEYHDTGRIPQLYDGSRNIAAAPIRCVSSGACLGIVLVSTAFRIWSNYKMEKKSQNP